MKYNRSDVAALPVSATLLTLPAWAAAHCGPPGATLLTLLARPAGPSAPKQCFGSSRPNAQSERTLWRPWNPRPAAMDEGWDDRDPEEDLRATVLALQGDNSKMQGDRSKPVVK